MSRTFHHGERRIRVKAIRRNPPDARGMARALIELARAQMEAEAQAQQEAKESEQRSKNSPRPKSRRKKEAEHS
jgi:hypothetical protein